MTTSEQAITFEPRPSAALSRVLLGVTLLGTAAPLFTGLPWWTRLALCLVACVHGLCRVKASRTSPCGTLSWASCGTWTVADGPGAAHVAELRGFHTVGAWVLLRIFWRKGRALVVAGPDNTDAETLRVLRVRLNRR